jgi:hypothetical protein
MQKEYGKEKGKTVFYASENKGTIKGVKKKGKSLMAKKGKNNATVNKKIVKKKTGKSMLENN